MPAQREPTATPARSAAFDLAFGSSRSPVPYDVSMDAELLPVIRERAPVASLDECLDALVMVRSLCDTVYDICEAFREGRFGKGADAARSAIDELSRNQPGFSDSQYEEAFTAGLLWTAF